MRSRVVESERAARLEAALGAGYRIAYDQGESGMTWCYYNGELYKRVDNRKMRGDININDFRVSPDPIQYWLDERSDNG